MKSRVITGVIWGLIGITFLCFFFTPAVGLFVILASVISAREIMNTVKVTNKTLIAFTMVVAGIVPPIIEYGAQYNFDIWSKIPFTPSMLILIFLFILIVIMLKNFSTVKFEHIAMALVASVVVPFCLSTILLVRDFYKFFGTDVYTKTNCFYIAFFGLICSWITDTFAYFVGSKFGKHKLCPNISPKKSVEGAIGGLVGTAIFNVLVWIGFYIVHKLGHANPLVIPLWAVPILSLVLSGISMLGDLSFSVMKRNFGIKDFGKFMGSHGGILDRFDSYITVMPTIYILIYIFTTIQK